MPRLQLVSSPVPLVLASRLMFAYLPYEQGVLIIRNELIYEYTTSIPMQELRAEEGGGLIIRTIRWLGLGLTLTSSGMTPTISTWQEA